MIHSVPETSSAMLFAVFPLQTQRSQLLFGSTLSRWHHHLRNPMLQSMDSFPLLQKSCFRWQMSHLVPETSSATLFCVSPPCAQMSQLLLEMTPSRWHCHLRNPMLQSMDIFHCFRSHVSHDKWSTWCLRRAQPCFSVFFHCKLKDLNWSLDRRHLGGTIISAIRFYKAWTSFIALEFMFHLTNEPLGAWDELSHAFRCFSTASSKISTDLWIDAI
jgi:hypothetical protein